MPYRNCTLAMLILAACGSHAADPMSISMPTTTPAAPDDPASEHDEKQTEYTDAQEDTKLAALKAKCDACKAAEDGLITLLKRAVAEHGDAQEKKDLMDAAEKAYNEAKAAFDTAKAAYDTPKTTAEETDGAIETATATRDEKCSGATTTTEGSTETTTAAPTTTAATTPTWSMWMNKFAGGYADSEDGSSPTDKSDAMKKCIADESCKAITCAGANGTGCTLRAMADGKLHQSSSREYTYVIKRAEAGL